MQRIVRILLGVVLLAAIAGCTMGRSQPSRSHVVPDIGQPAELRQMAQRAARANDIPGELIHRVIMRESGYNPAARNGPYWGLMQIHPDTARTMGFRGAPQDLLDPETNLRYAGRYLRGAYLVADGDFDKAIGWYARGYYFEARDRGMLELTGLR